MHTSSDPPQANHPELAPSIALLPALHAYAHSSECQVRTGVNCPMQYGLSPTNATLSLCFVANVFITKDVWSGSRRWGAGRTNVELLVPFCRYASVLCNLHICRCQMLFLLAETIFTTGITQIMTKENRRDFITCKVEEVNKEIIFNLINTMRVHFMDLRPQLSGSPKESYEQAIKTLREVRVIGEGEEAKARAELVRKVHSMQKLERLLNSRGM